MMCRMVSLVVLAQLTCAVGARSQEQKLEQHLRVLEPLVGVRWVGRFVVPTETERTPRLQSIWERALDGNAIKWTREAPAVGLRAETIYYWDRERKQLAFLMVSTQGVVSRGSVTVEGGLIVHLGLQITPATLTEYKQTFELLPDGRLRDSFYVRTPNGWEQRHLILHDPVPLEPG